MGELEGRVAIITGSTSGMGRGAAYRFAEEGAKVVVVGRNEERAKAVVDKIKEGGGEAVYVLADSSSAEAPQQIFDATMAAYGTVDILFNNAGKLSLTPFMDLSLDEWNHIVNVNVNTSLRLTQLCAAVMKEKGKGVVINTASVAGLAAHHGFAAYVMSKHAVVGMTKAMAWELGPEIRCNAIAPGAIDTAMLDSVGGVAAMDMMVQGAPVKRVGLPEDIGNAAVFLASDRSSFIDGQIIQVDGGFEC
jgi:3-oxoacyl-[acyl-carrier protein] reductase